MINTLEIRVTAASPQKPLPPWFSFQGSPSSVRVIDVPKSVGNWQITGVQVQVLYPDNQSIVKEAVRTGSVWVATIEGCETAGKVVQGYQITASGKDENDTPVEGYVLGCGDVFVMDVSNDIKALVGKTAVRYLEDLPTTPVEGDMYLANGTMKFYTGSEWVDFGGGSTEDLVTKEEFNEYKEEVTASLSAIDSSLSILSASVSSFGESITAIEASVSTMGSSISTISSQMTRLSSSISTLTSNKRDYTDKSWKYTKTTDPVMYGVKKFFLTRDEDGQESHSYNLIDFDETNKVWSEYEAPITIKAYSPSLYAVIDENNPHTFEFDDEEYNGWEFYRINDSDTGFTVYGGGANIEYHITLTRRSDDSFAMQSDVDSKRDYSDITWDYPMDADKDMFGVGYFVVDTGTQTYLREFSNVVDGDENIWKTWQSIGTNGWKIDTVDGHHYNLYRITSGTSAKVGEFTRTSDTNLRWDVAIGSSSEVLVRAYRREAGTLAVYEPNANNSNQRYLMFGQSSSSAGVVICDDVSAKANSFIKVDEMMITGPNYTSSRGVQTRGTRDVDTHLKVNGSAVAFVSEVEAATSQLSSEIGTVTASVSAMTSAVEALGSQVSALTSSIADKRDYDDLTYNDKTVRAPTYGICKFTATPSDGTDPNVMNLFFIHENPSDPERELGSCWWSSGMYVGTKDGINFRLVNVRFVEEATFTKTQILNGEITFTHGGKEWTLTAELGDGMVDKFDIWINKMKWTTSHYAYDSQTKTSKWWFQDNGFFLTRSWSSESYISLSDFWQASLYRGDDGVHGNVLVDRFNVGGTVGYRAGGYLPSFTYGDNTQPIEWQVAGYPCQGTFGFSECVPTRNSQLVNDAYFVRESEMASQLAPITASVSALDSQVSANTSAISANTSSIAGLASSVSAMASAVEALGSSVSAMTSSIGEVTASVSTMESSITTLGSSVSALASSMATKREFFDLVYPNFNDNIYDGFGMSFAYSFEGGMGSILPFKQTEYINGELCATWGWHGEILVAMPNQSTIWLFDKYDNLKHSIPLTEFKKATLWLDYVSPAQDDMVIDALEVPRIVYLYLATALDGREKNTKIVLENQLSAYATTSALGAVTASVSTMASSISTLESNVSSVTASVSTMASSIDVIGSSVSALASSMSSKRDYLDLGYSYTSTSTVMQSILDPLYKNYEGWDWEYNYGGADRNPWGITAMTITFPSEFVSHMEEGLEDAGVSLPEGYSALPSTYDLEWVEDENVGEYRWMPTGSIVSPEGSTWKEYFMYFAGDCFKINTSGIVEGAETWQNTNLAVITGMSWTLEGYDAMGGELSADITINGTRSEYKEQEDGYFVGASNFYNISAEPTNFTMTWFDSLTGDVITGSATITPTMPTSTSTVTVSDTIALQGDLSAYAPASSLNVSGIGCSTIVLSGTYSDSTSFAYNFVIQPSA